VVLTVSFLCIWRSKWTERRQNRNTQTYSIKSFNTHSSDLLFTSVIIRVTQHTHTHIRTVCDPKHKSNKNTSDIHYIQTGLYLICRALSQHTHTHSKPAKLKT